MKRTQADAAATQVDAALNSNAIDYDDFRNYRGWPVSWFPEYQVPELPPSEPLQEFRSAQSAAVATFTAVSSRYAGDPLPENIVSDYAFELREGLKGSAPLTFTMRGGSVNGDVLIEYNTPAFQPGSSYLLLFYSGESHPAIVRLVENGMVVTPSTLLPLQVFRDAASP